MDPREFVVLHHVLKDCHEMITENPTVPKSIDVCLEMCLQKYRDLLNILENLLAKPKYWRRLLYTFKEHELLTTYNGFRDSVLLLRDLSSDMKMNRQFVQISVAMAKIMEEEAEDEDEDEDELESRDDTARPSADLPEGTPHQPSKAPASKRPKYRRGGPKFLADFANLLSSDFTRSLILVIEVEDVSDHTRFKMVPVRNKIDTGSDENFVSKALIAKHGMDPNKVQDLPVEKQQERTLEMLNNLTFTPKQEVTISWHKPQDKKIRETTFLIVDSGLFDVLIGSKHWADEARQSVLFSFGRHRMEAERKQEELDDQNAEKESKQTIQKQLKETDYLLPRVGSWKKVGEPSEPTRREKRRSRQHTSALF
ncbi:hypothetical protein SLS63_006698 [Diaporthe eres]|uniref:Uncharacterized protein n=1 Tax=Diaporthe eres TaxID=83184 RepID=A0ABR1P782_DIAER